VDVSSLWILETPIIPASYAWAMLRDLLCSPNKAEHEGVICVEPLRKKNPQPMDKGHDPRLYLIGNTTGSRLSD